MLLLSSCFICSFLVPSSFSLPGKWGHKRSGFKFALPGKWGSILKRNSAFGFSLPGQWAGKRSAEYAMSNDVRMAGCDVDTLSIVLQMYDFIKVGSFSHVIRKNAKFNLLSGTGHQLHRRWVGGGGGLQYGKLHTHNFF